MPERIQVVNVLSNPGQEWPGAKGYVSADLIRSQMGPSLADCHVFLCGPPHDEGRAGGARIPFCGLSSDPLRTFRPVIPVRRGSMAGRKPGLNLAASGHRGGQGPEDPCGLLSGQSTNFSQPQGPGPPVPSCVATRQADLESRVLSTRRRRALMCRCSNQGSKE